MPSSGFSKAICGAVRAARGETWTCAMPAHKARADAQSHKVTSHGRWHSRGAGEALTGCHEGGGRGEQGKHDLSSIRAQSRDWTTRLQRNVDEQKGCANPPVPRCHGVGGLSASREGGSKGSNKGQAKVVLVIAAAALTCPLDALTYQRALCKGTRKACMIYSVLTVM